MCYVRFGPFIDIKKEWSKKVQLDIFGSLFCEF